MKLPLIFVTAFALSGCVSKTAYESEDALIVREIRRSGAAKARQVLAKQEKGAREKIELAWLALVTGEPAVTSWDEVLPNPPQIVEQGGSAFFTQKTSDGYDLAEHEIIVVGFIRSLEKYRSGDLAAAAEVVGKTAGVMDQMEKLNPAFRSAVLRIMLGFVYAQVGDWPKARLQFQAAAKQDAADQFLAQIAQPESAPRKLELVLGGTGRLPRQNKSAPGQISFTSDWEIPVAWKTPAAQTSQVRATEEWYVRMMERNVALDGTIDTGFSSSNSQATVVSGLGKVSGSALKGTGIVAGIGAFVGTLYAIAQVTNVRVVGDAPGIVILPIFAGVAVGGPIYAAGKNIEKGSQERSKVLSTQSVLNRVTQVKYLRYLPEFVWLRAASEEGSAPAGAAQMIDLGPSDAQRIRANLEYVWVDPATFEAWAFVDGGALTAKEGAAACAFLENRHGRESWTFPNWQQLQSLWTNRAAFRGLEVAWEQMKLSSRVWSRTNSGTPGKCGVFFPADRSLGGNEDCMQPSSVICVAPAVR